MDKIEQLEKWFEARLITTKDAELIEAWADLKEELMKVLTATPAGQIDGGK